MEKVKRFLLNLSIRKSIVLYILVFTVFALVLSMSTVALCNYESDRILSRYPTNGEKYYLTNEAGERLGEGTYIGTEATEFSDRDEWLLHILDIIPILTAPVYSAFCIIMAAFLLYKNKLKRPISELKTASEKIAENNLDFYINYQSEDELGELCSSFEIMRLTLSDNFSSIWRQVEERKQLNAAFAHDLRTPLTVLKGYNEILQTSDDNMTKEISVTMGKHIIRLESYIDSMSRLRRLEDAKPEYEETELEPFLNNLAESTLLLCEQNYKHLQYENNTVSKILYIDKSFVSQVLENLVSNAVRYAKETVIINVKERDNGLLLSVSDDGKGFSDEAMKNAVVPYFTSETNHSQHFGLGLYICKLLCEHHGGSLKMENISQGAKATAFFKQA